MGLISEEEGSSKKILNIQLTQNLAVEDNNSFNHNAYGGAVSIPLVPSIWSHGSGKYLLVGSAHIIVAKNGTSGEAMVTLMCKSTNRKKRQPIDLRISQHVILGGPV